MSRAQTAATTPATSALASAGVWHRVYTYAHASETTEFGQEAVDRLGVDPNRLLKTLVVTTDQGRFANALLATANKLDFKRLAKVLETKSVRLAEASAAQRKTGYVLGGISPLGQKTVLPTVIDHSVQAHETVWVSGGQRGTSVELRVADLIELTAGHIAPITRV